MIADACTAQLAKSLGRNDVFSDFLATSRNWKKEWNSRIKFLCALDSSGKYTSCDSPYWNSTLSFVFDDVYAEGDAWQYRFSPSHDVPGLISAFGGSELFVHELLTFMVLDVFLCFSLSF